MAKTEPYVCPVCKGEDADCFDYEWDSECIRQRYNCNVCGAVWDEYHELTYRGYAHKHIDYDENGNEMQFNEVIAPTPPSEVALFVTINQY